jgi:hypothetical protein
MVTPADVEWIREERRKEIYQLTEARWAMEGVFVPRSTRPIIQPGSWLRRLKTFVFKQKPVQETAKQDQHNHQHTQPSLS